MILRGRAMWSGRACSIWCGGWMRYGLWGINGRWWIVGLGNRAARLPGIDWVGEIGEITW